MSGTDSHPSQALGRRAARRRSMRRGRTSGTGSNRLVCAVRTLGRGALVTAVAVAAVACGGKDTGSVVTVGAGDSPQSRMIAELYAGALARTGLHTRVADRVGARTELLAGLDSGDLALFGDITGDILTALDSTATVTTPEAVNAALAKALPQGVTTSDPADGTDLRPAIVASAAHPTALPSSLKDLGPRCDGLIVGIDTGAPLDAQRAPLDPERDVLTPLQSVYHCAITRWVTFTTPADLRKALSEGEIHLGVLPGPASFLPGDGADLTALADPDYAFRAAMVAPILRKSALTDPQLRKLNYVAGELTTTELADMIHQIRDQNAIPSSVARTWLDAHAL
ncbi:glycine betaine ABC transporter substrate-binding protein [Nocardia sp. NPDC004582]